MMSIENSGDALTTDPALDQLDSAYRALINFNIGAAEIIKEELQTGNIQTASQLITELIDVLKVTADIGWSYLDLTIEHNKNNNT